MEQPQSLSAQQITPANELVPLNKQVAVRICNNKNTLPNIPCSKECRIVGQILVDHALIYALTATADVLESIPKRLKEGYHTIKDDTPLVNMYTSREVTVRGMQIPNDLMRDEIKDTQAYKDYMKDDDRERDEIIEATQLSLAIDKTSKVYEEQQNVVVVEIRILEEDVEKLVKGEDESSGSDFADTMLLSDKDSGYKIEPGSRKEKPEEIVNDGKMKDDDAKIDEKKDDDESSQVVVPTLISQEFDAHASKIIEELFRIHMHNTVRCLRKRDHDDHPGDDAPLKGEKSPKRQKTSRSSKSTKGSSSKQPAKESNTSASEQPQQQDFDAWRVPTIYDHERMEATIKDMLSNQFRDAKEYAYHLKQAKNYMKNQVVWESRQDDLSRPKKDAPLFYEEKRVMDLIEIAKFCDATLEKVLKEVKLKIFETELKTKTSLLGELDLEIMKAYERDIMKHLKHRKRMRRWESFVNGRPILQSMKRQK
nr:hypothetical protein [Tanacetum cinerariifolium]